MTDPLARNYQLYLNGCISYGYEPVPIEEFKTTCLEFEEYAETLRRAEASGRPPEIDAAERTKMQDRVQNDPIVKALLVGIAEEQTEDM